MSKEGAFAVFCAEQYKFAKGLTGEQVANLFTRCGIWRYIYDTYEALHTTGTNYIIEDIDGMIQEFEAGKTGAKACFK